MGSAHQQTAPVGEKLSRQNVSEYQRLERSPWDPALVAVHRRRARKRPQTHAHPHPHALRQRTVKIKVHVLTVHEVTEQNGVNVTVQAVGTILHLQVGCHTAVGIVLLPRVTIVP